MNASGNVAPRVLHTLALGPVQNFRQDRRLTCLGAGGPFLKPFKSCITRPAVPLKGRPGGDEPPRGLGLDQAAHGHRDAMGLS